MKGQPQKKVVIVGAGIAGLAAAHCLRKCGVEVEIVEREAVVGGVARSVLKEERYLLELGPNAFLGSEEPVGRLARELSIDGLIVGNEELSRKRFIHRGGRNHPLPTGPISFLGSGVLSFPGKLRLLAEPFVRSTSPPEETLAAFARRRAGRRVLDALVDPFASGVWAGDPAELEVASILPRLVEIEARYGSLLRGMRHVVSSVRRGLYSFRWGMGTLAARLEEELRGKIRTGIAAEGIERVAAGGWRVRFAGWHAAVEADAVIVALPAFAAAKAVLSLDPKLFTSLQGIPYAPVAIVHTAFKEGDVPVKPEGFGVLIPRSEGIRMLGSLWPSSLFPSRCPAGEVLLTNFIGGATDPAIADLSDGEIVEEVLRGLQATMGIAARPVFTFIKRWGQGIAQYTVGHGGRIAVIREELAGLPGLWLTGSYFEGVSVSDTIAHARRTAEETLVFLRARG